MAKRPYSKAFTARQNPKTYLLVGIPPTFWGRVQQKARREHRAVRNVILSLLTDWVRDEPAELDVAGAEGAGES